MIPTPRRFQLADHLEEFRDLGVVERGRRLVHDQHARVERQRLGDLHHLLLGDRQPADDRARIERQAHVIENGRRLAVELVFVEQEAERALGFAADENILRDGQMIHQLQFLMNDPDSRRLSLARTGEIDRSAVVKDGPAVLDVDAGQDLHQRRFAGAVLAHQRVNLAGHELEPDVAQRAHAGEGLADVL